MTVSHKHLYYQLLILLLPSPVHSGEGRSEEIPAEKYLASTIERGLTTNAVAVVRYESEVFTAINDEEAYDNVVRLITILNPDGREFGELMLAHDKFVKVDDLDGAIYDAGGTRVRSLSSTDVKEYPGTPEYSLYEDNRVTVVKLYHNTYPYTVKFEYVIRYDGYVSWPTWYPEAVHASVEYSKFQVILGKGGRLRYESNGLGQPKVTNEGNQASYVWEVHGLDPFESEPVGPRAADQYRSVQIAPEHFEVDGYSGDLTSWKSFGEWFHRLLKGRQELPEQAKQDFLALTCEARNSKEVVRRLYEYLQSTTRYVSVQLGIGSWQPFEASYVHERRYGDCKALTNYMMAILRTVNIQSYPALIFNGNIPRRISESFPVNCFNHVILSIPTEKDTTWLECTSQSIPFGHIGSSNENRPALLISPSGGTLVRTPSSRSSDNCQLRKADVVLAPNGNGVADVQTSYTGNQQDFVRWNLRDASPGEREEWVRENVHIPAFHLESADFSGIQQRSDTVSILLKFQLPRYAVSAGNRLLFQPNLMQRRSWVPPPVEKRVHPVMHSYPYLDVDSITYKLPDGFSVEALPKQVVIEKPFASYRANFVLHGPDLLVYIRRLEVVFTELAPELFDEYRSFLLGAAQADKASVALLRK